MREFDAMYPGRETWFESDLGYEPNYDFNDCPTWDYNSDVVPDNAIYFDDGEHLDG